MGLGRFFARFDGESDGTVGVNETRIAGATDFTTVPTGHMGLVVSSKVAREAGTFLRDGHFSRAGEPHESPQSPCGSNN